MMTSPTCSNRRSAADRRGRARPRHRRLAALVAALLTGIGQTSAAHDDHDHNADTSPLAQAMTAQAHHDFDRALTLVDEALRRNPNDASARLQQMALHLIRGEPHRASAACRALGAVPAIVAITCHARVAHARDDVKTARARLERVLTVSPPAGEPAVRAWTLGVAGDLAVAAGEPSAGVDYYRQSLAIADHHQVRASLVEVLMATRDYREARRVATAGRGSLTLSVQKLIIDRNLGQDIARRTRRLRAQFQRLEATQNYEHAREMARFYLDVVDDPKRAWHLAKINAARQHEPEDRILLARARAANTSRGQIEATPTPGSRSSK